MSIIVSNIRIGLDEPENTAVDIAIKKLNIEKSLIKNSYIYKKSLDARRRTNVSFVTSVLIDLIDKEAETVKAVSDPFVSYKEKLPLNMPQGKEKLERPIVIIGFGPAGLFAANALSELGYNPIVFEMGSDIDARVHAIEQFWKQGILNEKSNVQFGEGGAGTFSDGKLTTRISDSRCDYILEKFVENGAPKEILSTAKPHIGTDKLRNVIKSMRQNIIKNGGEVHFNKTLEDIKIKNDTVEAVVINGEIIETNNVILAVGHSSRDTFRMLHQNSVEIENKNFSVGLRIEQLQSTIDKGLYGDLAGHPAIPRGEYQLSHKQGSRCVYTFCMCPGGFVIPSASSNDTIVTNGMSEHARDGKNANSALVVSVDKNDFGTNPLDGIIFQEKIEDLAFKLGGGGYKAPAVTVKEFLEGKKSIKLKNVLPTYSLGVEPVDFGDIFSNDIIKMLRAGLVNFNGKLNGFSAGDGILTGVETRTSSPVRILRDDESGMSVNVKGLYPCGEGSGYAGGIMSAAVDGIKTAQKVIALYTPSK